MMPTSNAVDDTFRNMNINKSEERGEEEVPELPIIYVDTESKLQKAVKELSQYNYIGFDTEGVNLSRSGKLTIATFQGFKDKKKKRGKLDHEEDSNQSPIYIVDVLVLGGHKVFSKTSSRPSLCSILEDCTITKVTFDCRSDSDALYHQFNVSLTGTFDLQVFDQAVRIHEGDLPPKRNEFVTSGKRYLSSMEKILGSRYSIMTSLVEAKVKHPHKHNLNVWKDRPLSSASLEYAGNDVAIIKLLWHKMLESNVSDLLMERTILHSKRYESMFRDRATEVSYSTDKDFMMEEHAIILESELPPNHPRKLGHAPSNPEQRWIKAVQSLELRLPSAFNEVIFVLQHNDWFTDRGREEITRLASNYPFTSKQRYRISNPPSLAREEDYYDDHYYGDY